jgi:hypothetical protein
MMPGEITAFLDDKVVAQGDPAEVLRIIEERYAAAPAVRAFDDETGRVVDLDYWGAAAASTPPARRGRGRPKLGVVAREVTLLPRQWDWLSAQPGGASAALRRLVEEGRKASPTPQARRDAVYRFMSDLCGDRPGYEEALRALYRGERERFAALIGEWPEGVRAYIGKLLGA